MTALPIRDETKIEDTCPHCGEDTYIFVQTTVRPTTRDVTVAVRTDPVENP